MDNYDNMLDVLGTKVEKAIKKAGHKKFLVFYSAYETDENDEPIDNLDELAVRGKALFFMEEDEFWGGEDAKFYKSKIVENPTWLDLCVLVNEGILMTNDHHHVFFEGIELEKSKKLKKNMDFLKVLNVIGF